MLLSSLSEHLSEEPASAQFREEDPVKWITSHFWIPELRGPMRLYPYHIACLREATRRDENGKFIYSTVVWSDIKKSAKSTIAAAVGLWRAFQVDWGTVYVVANDLKQADSRVSYYMRRAIELNPAMSGVKVKPSGYKITTPGRSTVESIPIDPKGEAGSNADMIIFSELWGAKQAAAKQMWSEMTLSPLKFGISQRWVETYAGFEGESPILEMLYNQGVNEGNKLDLSYEDPDTGEFYDLTGLNVYANQAARLFCLWNVTPWLPWQTPEYYCLPLPDKPNDLKVLTDHGWINAQDITRNEALCTRNEAGKIEYQKPVNIYTSEYKGEIYHLKTRKGHLSMTPKHRVLGAYANHTRKVKNILSNPFIYEYRPAFEARKTQIGWIPGHGEWEHTPLQEISAGKSIYCADDFIELTAWYLAEGNIHYSKWKDKKYPSAIFIAQSQDKNPEKYELLKNLCERLSLPYKPRKNRGEIVGIIVYDTRLGEYFEKFGKSHEKYIPRFILEHCSLGQLRKFFEVYILADGTKRKSRSWILYTNSDQMALDLMELAFKCGYRPHRLGSYSSSPQTKRKPIHHISVMTSHLGWSRRAHWYTSFEDVTIWCPTLPNGNFYVMQNGICYWTGNSQEEAILEPSEFQRMHRNQWASSLDKFVPDEWVYACQDDYMPPLKKDQPVVLVSDAAISGDSFGVLMLSGRGDGRYDVRYSKAWKPPKGGKIAFSTPEGTGPEDEIRRLMKEYYVIEWVYDPYQLEDMAGRLKQELITHVHAFGQGQPRLIADKKLQDNLKSRAFRHRGEPELISHIRNANAKHEGDNKLRLVKRSPESKIDLAVCASMGLDRAQYWQL